MATETGENKYKKYGQPTLDLVFTGEKKSLTDRAGNVAVEFTRTQDTQSTYVGSDGLIKTAATNEARFDHDLTTGENLGLLIEESRTNSIVNSDTLLDFTTGSCSRQLNAGISPDGTFRATKIIESSLNEHQFAADGIDYNIENTATTFTVFLKSGERTNASITIGAGNAIASINVDLTDGSYNTFTNSSPWWTNVTYDVTPFPNSWYKVRITGTNSYTINQIRFYPCINGTALNNYDATNVYQGDGTSGFYISFPQLEAGSFPTSYIPTTATFTSRASEATYYDQNGIVSTASTDVARSDAYFPDENGNFISAGLLLEEERTNYAIHSDGFDQGVWGIAFVTPTADTNTAPDGTATADTLTFNGAGYIYQQVTTPTISIGGNLTFSIWVWSPSKSVIGIRVADTATGTIQSFQTVSLTGTAQRASVTVTATSATSQWSIGLDNRSGLGGDQVSGDVIAWGAQLEEGSYATSYIPTTSGISTRAADISSSGISTRGADTASISNAINTDDFTIVNIPFGSASGSDTFQILGAGSSPVKRTTVYGRNLNQSEINSLANVTDDFWRWRVLGSSFALPTFTTDGQVTVDWGDGTVETLTTSEHTFSNGGSYHEIGFRLDSGTYFGPNVGNNATHKDKVVAAGPVPASMLVYGGGVFYKCSNLNAFDPTAVLTVDANYGWNGCSSLKTFPSIDTSNVTALQSSWRDCTSLTSFPAIDTSNVTDFTNTWTSCNSLTSFPLIDVSSASSKFQYTWQNCSSLTSFPLIDFSACTSLVYTWINCSSLTSFPLINTSSVTNFDAAWRSCSSLTSFPLIDTSSGTSFGTTWEKCSSLTSFPLINTSSGTTFYRSWYDCSSLTTFPANLFDSWTATPTDNCFTDTWDGCSSLSSTSVENILNSISVSAGSTTPPGIGSAINVDYNAGSGTPDVAVSVIDLSSKGWTPTLNGIAKTDAYEYASLDLNFAVNKNLNDDVTDTNLITFTRTQDTQASYVSAGGTISYASANEPRFDHDPTTGESLGLLIEESRTNYFEDSSYFNQDFWSVSGSNVDTQIIPNSAVAPDGTFTATKLVSGTGISSTSAIQTTNTVYGIGGEGRMQVSVFVKPAGYNFIAITGGNGSSQTIFDLSSLTSTNSGGSPVPETGTIESYSNGWYRCTFKPYRYGSASLYTIYVTDNSSSTSFTGDGNSGIYIWGAQIEEKISFPTSYIPTTPTFTSRASEATYYDQNGIVSTASTDVARSDAYFPDENGVMKPAGLLLEAAGSNTQKYSVTFADWTRSPTASRVLNNSTSPDGTLTATKMVEGVGSQRQHINLTFNSTGIYTHSVFAKAAERQYLYMFPYSSGGNLYHFGVFDLVNGTSYSTSSGFYHKIISLSNGWYRCVFKSYSSGFGDFEVGISPSANPADLAALDYQGDGSSGLYIWGMQTELNSVETSYIPTSGIATTRAADISSSSTSLRGADTASITGAGFSSFYSNSSEGSIFIDMKRPAVSSLLGAYLEFFDNAGLFLQDYGGNFISRIGQENNYIILGDPAITTDYKIASSYQSANDYKVSSNGSSVTSASTAIDFTTATELHIGRGNNAFTANWRNGTGTCHFSRITYWPKRLTDTSLQSLTE